MGGALAYKEEYEEYELINGQEYMMSRPSFNHMRVETNIFRLFDGFLKGKRCRAFLESNVKLSENDYVIPDVVIVCNPDILDDPWIKGVPDLVVEILSKSTEKRDRFDKLLLYERCGVREYWIVEPSMKSVTVYLLRDGKFELDDIYHFYTAKEWSAMNDKERAEAEARQTIEVSLHDDFLVDVNDVFEDVD